MDNKILLEALHWLHGTDTGAATLTHDALSWANQPIQHLLLDTDPAYPKLLKQIDDYPPLLFIKGALPSLQRPMIAMVGSRNSTAYGRSVAYRIAQDLAKSGLVICSGLAMGIDAQAHQAALEVGGTTVAVLGNGLHSVYPPQHHVLAQRIVDSGGALVSELPLAAGPVAFHFPKRNRIIAGLSLGTLVVEANMRSGSLITARLALEQNREVFAVPGSVNSPVSRGCHRLLRQGAVLTESADDIIEHIKFLCEAQLALSYPEFALTPPQSSDGSLKRIKVPKHLHRLWAELCDDPISLDRLTKLTGLTLPELSAGLLELQLAGLAILEGNRCWRLP